MCPVGELRPNTACWEVRISDDYAKLVLAEPLPVPAWFRYCTGLGPQAKSTCLWARNVVVAPEVCTLGGMYEDHEDGKTVEQAPDRVEIWSATGGAQEGARRP
jgi:hypothetical protein